MFNFDARVGAHPTYFSSAKSRQKHSLRRTTLRVPSRTRSNRRGRKLASLRHTASCFLFALRRSVARKSQLVLSGLSVGTQLSGRILRATIRPQRGLPRNKAQQEAGGHASNHREAIHHQINFGKNKSNLTCRSRALSAKIILPATIRPRCGLLQTDRQKS